MQTEAMKSTSTAVPAFEPSSALNMNSIAAPRTHGWLPLVTRILLGGLFVFAGSIKLQSPQLFAFAIGAFKILPDHLIALSAFVVPWTEIIAGLCLITGFWGRAAALVIGGMLVVFLAGILSVIVRGLDVKCTCFGKFEVPCVGPVGWCHVARNSVMLAMAVLVIWKGSGSLALDRVSKG
jgi:putative oxidoreductase